MGVQLGSYAAWLRVAARRGPPLAAGGRAVIADFSVAQSIWFIRRAPPVTGDPRRLPARLVPWYERVAAPRATAGRRRCPAARRIAIAARRGPRADARRGWQSASAAGDPVRGLGDRLRADETARRDRRPRRRRGRRRTPRCARRHGPRSLSAHRLPTSRNQRSGADTGMKNFAKGRTAVITGAASGFPARETIAPLRPSGHERRHGRRPAGRLTTAAAEIARLGAQVVLPIRLDVSKAAEVEALAGRRWRDSARRTSCSTTPVWAPAA